MKTLHLTSILSLLIALMAATPLSAQDGNSVDSTGLPGDHFSLEGAIELFKKAESPEDFEKLLNTEGSNVNNLDLNEDGDIDYIRVIDNMDGEAHALVLQVPVSEAESQDIAVIEIEKQGEEDAILQIVGDEAVFGEEVIAEPFEEEAKDNGRGPSVTLARVVVNVWGWPSVRFAYRPGYRPWVSPWRWRVYPAWWSPWRPHPWRAFHVAVRPWHRHCHVVTTHRVGHAHQVYTPHRSRSTVVHTRTTTVVKGRNGKVIGGKTTKTTTIKGRGGNTVTKKTTTKGRRGRRG